MKRAIVDLKKARGAILPMHCIPYSVRGGRQRLESIRAQVGEEHYVFENNVGGGQKEIDAIREQIGEAELYARICENAIGYGKSVDVPFLFPRFDADVNDPASYYFPQTDYVMADAVTYAKHLIYTLGAPREWHEPRIFCNVPSDFEKWTDVCSHIIRHYNCGLWNGFYHGIEYFEIWNEPDNPVFWNGSVEDYCRLYEATAKTIKAIDPALQVGGGSFALLDETGIAFAKQFLAYVKKHCVPLDFFSYHAHDTDPNSIAYRAARVREMLAEYGCAIQVFQTSWACVDEKADERVRFAHLRDAQGAAYASAVMSVMQSNRVDASITSTLCTEAYGSLPYCSLLDWHGEWQKPVHALIAYHTLYALGTEAETQAYGLYVTAATNCAGKAAILVTHFDEDCTRGEILVKGWRDFRVTYRVLDATRDLTPIKTEDYRNADEGALLAAELRGYTTLLLELEQL